MSYSVVLPSFDEKIGFVRAAGLGRVDELETFLQKYPAYINIHGSGGATALTEAAAHGQTKAAAYLIARGADVNATDTWNRTPLLWAAWKGHSETMEVFLQSGAHVNVTDIFGATALMRAAYAQQQTSVERLLLCPGIAVNKIMGSTSSTALDIAMAQKNTAIISPLVKASAVAFNDVADAQRHYCDDILKNGVIINLHNAPRVRLKKYGS